MITINRIKMSNKWIIVSILAALGVGSLDCDNDEWLLNIIVIIILKRMKITLQLKNFFWNVWFAGQTRYSYSIHSNFSFDYHFTILFTFFEYFLIILLLTLP